MVMNLIPIVIMIVIMMPGTPWLAMLWLILLPRVVLNTYTHTHMQSHNGF